MWLRLGGDRRCISWTMVRIVMRVDGGVATSSVICAWLASLSWRVTSPGEVWCSGGCSVRWHVHLENETVDKSTASKHSKVLWWGKLWWVSDTTSMRTTVMMTPAFELVSMQATRKGGEVESLLGPGHHTWDLETSKIRRISKPKQGSWHPTPEKL